MTPQKPNYDEKLDQMLVILGEIKGTMLLHTAELARLSKCAEENKSAIKGNGKVGLEVNMALVQESIKRIQKILATITTIVGAEIIALLLAILTHKISIP